MNFMDQPLQDENSKFWTQIFHAMNTILVLSSETVPVLMSWYVLCSVGCNDTMLVTQKKTVWGNYLTGNYLIMAADVNTNVSVRNI